MQLGHIFFCDRGNNTAVQTTGQKCTQGDIRQQPLLDSGLNGLAHPTDME